MQVDNKPMKRYSAFWGVREMQIKRRLQIDKNEKDIKFSRECWKNTFMRS